MVMDESAEGDFPLDHIGCPSLSDNQKTVLLYLFDRGETHAYAMARKKNPEKNMAENNTGLIPQSVKAVLDRLESGRLVRRADITREGKRPERTIYALSAQGFFAAIMLVLQKDLSPPEIALQIQNGIERHSGMQFDDLICNSAFLEKWHLIMQATEVYDGPLFSVPGVVWSGHEATYEIVVKKHPYGIWFAALHNASRAMYMLFESGLASEYAKDGNVGQFFDLGFGNFLTVGEGLILSPPPWLDFCYRVLETDDELTQFLVFYLERAKRQAEEAIVVYQATIDQYKKKE